MKHLFPCRRSRAKMLFQLLFLFLGCMLTVQCRDTGKTFRSIPSITSSLVNLGKMDISFYFNAKESPFKTESPANTHHSLHFSKSEPIVEEPCLCSGLRGIRDNFGHPSDILNKILTSSDLFSFNKEPATSTLCCGSHERAQEDVITFEFGPKNIMPLNSNSNLPKLPFIFENFLPRRSPIIPMSQISPMSQVFSLPPVPMKAKTVDIFLFPKKRDSPIKKDLKNDVIQIVGDKELRNDFKTLKYRPSNAINIQSSVKKDLTAQERNETKAPTDKEDIEIPKNNPNSL